MRRFTATNCLTILTVLAGFTSAAGAATGNAPVQGIALGMAVALGSLLIRCIALDASRAAARHIKDFDAHSERASKARRAVDKGLEKLDIRVEKLGSRVEKLDKRIELESSRSTVRVLSEINAARLEQIDGRSADRPAH